MNSSEQAYCEFCDKHYTIHEVTQNYLINPHRMIYIAICPYCDIIQIIRWEDGTDFKHIQYVKG